MIDTTIVGAGIFGQTIAAALRKVGQEVLVIDSNEPMAGSKPSACLMKPSWFSSMGPDKYKPALELLNQVFGVEDITFDLRPPFKVIKKIGTATVHWCNPTKVLGGPVTKGKVQVFKHTDKGWIVKTLLADNKINFFVAKNLILAAGVWTRELINVPNIIGKAGAAFILPNHRIERPFIQPYRPYKQVSAFQRAEGGWIGDGTAINEVNWNKEYIISSYQRCMDALELPHTTKVTKLEGIRPFIHPKELGNNPCLLKEAQPGLWIATGGAKNGMISAAWCAYVIQNKL